MGGQEGKKEKSVLFFKVLKSSDDIEDSKKKNVTLFPKVQLLMKKYMKSL